MLKLPPATDPIFGWLAQPAERVVHTDEVTGSSPVPPTPRHFAELHREWRVLLLTPASPLRAPPTILAATPVGRVFRAEYGILRANITVGGVPWPVNSIGSRVHAT